jgi:hypothetical protein
MEALGAGLYQLGARAIFSPCAWAVPPDFDPELTPYGALWHRSYEALTGSRDLAIFAASNVGQVVGGPWDGHRCIGSSLAMGRGATVLGTGPFGVDAEALVRVEYAVGN